MDKEVASPTSTIVLRPSSDDDVPAMLDIYRQHIAHGVGNLGAFEPTPFDADDLKARRKSMLKHKLPISSRRTTAPWPATPTPGCSARALPTDSQSSTRSTSTLTISTSASDALFYRPWSRHAPLLAFSR